jgi:hypothetical protein
MAKRSENVSIAITPEQAIALINAISSTDFDDTDESWKECELLCGVADRIESAWPEIVEEQLPWYRELVVLRRRLEKRLRR